MPWIGCFPSLLGVPILGLSHGHSEAYQPGCPRNLVESVQITECMLGGTPKNIPTFISRRICCISLGPQIAGSWMFPTTNQVFFTIIHHRKSIHISLHMAVMIHDWSLLTILFANISPCPQGGTTCVDAALSLFDAKFAACRNYKTWYRCEAPSGFCSGYLGSTENAPATNGHFEPAFFAIEVQHFQTKNLWTVIRGSEKFLGDDAASIPHHFFPFKNIGDTNLCASDFRRLDLDLHELLSNTRGRHGITHPSKWEWWWKPRFGDGRW